MVRLLALAGSTRRASLNQALLSVAVAQARKLGAEVTEILLSSLDLPLYDGDLEERSGIPAGAMRLKQAMVAHHGLLLACPEYNGSLTAALKNAIDWASRQAPGEASLAAFRGKTASLIAASPGALGGLRGLVHVRAILGGLGVVVLPTQFALSRAHEAFGPDGALLDAGAAKNLDAVVREAVELTGRLHP